MITAEKDVCRGCGQTIWLRDGYWMDTIDPDYAFEVAHLCDKPGPGTSRHVPRTAHVRKPRQVVTEGLVFRTNFRGISHKYTGAVVHKSECRYAKDAQPVSDLIEALGHDEVRTKIAVGIIKPCGTCKPTLLVEG